MRSSLIQAIDRAAATKGELGAYDDMPPGPYRLGLTNGLPPYTVLCGDGRAVCGNISSRIVAFRIAVALEMREKMIEAMQKDA